jgi:hypothetical protein
MMLVEAPGDELRTQVQGWSDEYNEQLCDFPRPPSIHKLLMKSRECG